MFPSPGKRDRPPFMPPCPGVEVPPGHQHDSPRLHPNRSHAMPAWTLPLLACGWFVNRQRGDANPCGRSPIDFESITLATRSPCLGACSFGLASRACQWGYGATVARLTQDQKVGSSNLSVLNVCSGMLLCFLAAVAHMCCPDRWACVPAGCARLLRSLLWDSNPRPPAY